MILMGLVRWLCGKSAGESDFDAFDAENLQEEDRPPASHPQASNAPRGTSIPHTHTVFLTSSKPNTLSFPFKYQHYNTHQHSYT